MAMSYDTASIQQGQGAKIEPPPTLGAHISDLDGQVEHAAKILEHVTQVADRFLGGQPRDAGTGKDSTEHGNMLQRMKARDQRLFALLSQIDQQISRIENSI